MSLLAKWDNICYLHSVALDSQKESVMMRTHLQMHESFELLGAATAVVQHEGESTRCMLAERDHIRYLHSVALVS